MLNDMLQCQYKLKILDSFVRLTLKCLFGDSCRDEVS